MTDTMQRPMLAAAETFVDALRKVFADGFPEPERWERCRELLKELIADPEIKAHAQGWPVTGFNPKTDKVTNLLFYEDSEYGFVINGLIKNPGGSAMIHDHGPAWTIYGVLQGEERIVHYDTTERDGGGFDVSECNAEICGPGDVDVVPPRLVHSEYASAEKSIAVIVRSQRSGTFDQFRYLEDGSQIVFRGPIQAPYGLA
jgi:predicted metal-dependent enzyme (double-stranded beta helix superfamily)